MAVPSSERRTVSIAFLNRVLEESSIDDLESKQRLIRDRTRRAHERFLKRQQFIDLAKSCLPELPEQLQPATFTYSDTIDRQEDESNPLLLPLDDRLIEACFFRETSLFHNELVNDLGIKFKLSTGEEIVVYNIRATVTRNGKSIVVKREETDHVNLTPEEADKDEVLGLARAIADAQP